LLLAKGIVVFSLPVLFIPAASAPMLVAMLLGSPLAIFLTIVLSLFSGLLTNSLHISILCFAGGIVGVYAVEGIKRRAQLVKAGFLVGFVNLLVVVSLSLLRKQEFLELMKDGLWAMSQGLLSAFMVMGVLPLFEHLFKLTTNISLLELSDLNHPLLKRLIMEAPGTYHHSLIVGNLSESASEAIGANSLLARVASYYHDIGKIEKSEYFSENQKGKNKHNKLVPTMSSLIIIKHVKDGVEMCHKYNLPRQIIEIIKQHHGTSLVPYFYQRALDLEKDKKVNEESFRYPGPKPQSKEAAIVMLADSIEASSRSLDNPSPSRLKGLVQKIINDKFIDHQLDECNLALTDLSKITESFSYILNGVFHNRIKYPEREDS
ncbi:MAG: HDIG domain-containing protein, partial [Candidatus Omnitrophica bacterium]|nr:HDIG domain-containing protein [Candidatus Omnitrophota bacterium]